MWVQVGVPVRGDAMTQFIFTFLNGITLAGLYFLVASGLTLIFGLMRVINLAHGAFYLLAGYISWTVADKTDNWFFGAVAGALSLGVIGTLIYVLLLRKFQYEELRVALITLGVSLVLAQAMLAIFGGEYYQTNIPGYYAIGDVIPGPALAHVASAEGINCVEKIAGMHVEPIDYGNVPGCTYATPEIASVGLTEKQAKEKGYELKIGKFPFTASGKAKE